MQRFLPLLSLGALCLANEWTYDRCSEHGPVAWPNTCPPTVQQQGSPINLCGAQTLNAAPAFALANWDMPRTMTILDNKHTVQVAVVDTPPTTVLGNISAIVGRSASANPTTWTLRQMHLHWGRDGRSDEGSEHYLEGQRYPLEAHFVHYNAAAGSSPDNALASNRTDALLVVGVAFALGSQDNDVLRAISNDVAGITLAAKNLSSQVNLANVFNGTGTYYAYAGSLTTPPCAEQVTWVMMQRPLSVTSATLEKIKAATANPAQRKFTPLEDDRINQYGNFRPLQALNSRPVYLSSGVSATCPTAVTEPTFACTVSARTGTGNSAPGLTSAVSIAAAAVLPLFLALVYLV
eukprot:EG_transcript_5933